VKKIQPIIKYIRYLFVSVNERGANSPFVFDLLQHVIYVKADYYSYKLIEKQRERLLDSKQTVTFHDYGARASGLVTKRVSNIASTSAKSPKYAQLLFRLVNHFQPKHILELGTSLGISTSYLAMANTNADITTIEGGKELVSIANDNFKELKLKNIKQVVGNFDDVLSSVVDDIPSLDFVFFDGNHQKAATLRYFETCLAKSNENSVFVFDDINWSDEMREAWEQIKNHKQVTITLDLFFMGVVFFKKGQAKQHFIIRF
jgi:predicted O-methyltransferase YrrM